MKKIIISCAVLCTITAGTTYTYAQKLTATTASELVKTYAEKLNKAKSPVAAELSNEITTAIQRLEESNFQKFANELRGMLCKSTDHTKQITTLKTEIASLGGRSVGPSMPSAPAAGPEKAKEDPDAIRLTTLLTTIDNYFNAIKTRSINPKSYSQSIIDAIKESVKTEWQAATPKQKTKITQIQSFICETVADFATKRTAATYSTLKKIDGKLVSEKKERTDIVPVKLLLDWINYTGDQRAQFAAQPNTQAALEFIVGRMPAPIETKPTPEEKPAEEKPALPKLPKSTTMALRQILAELLPGLSYLKDAAARTARIEEYKKLKATADMTNETVKQLITDIDAIIK